MDTRWERTVKAAKTDSTLRGLASAILAANRLASETGCQTDHAAYGAFRDRVDELGLRVPNSFYYSVLLGRVLTAVRGG